LTGKIKFRVRHLCKIKWYPKAGKPFQQFHIALKFLRQGKEKKLLSTREMMGDERGDTLKAPSQTWYWKEVKKGET